MMMMMMMDGVDGGGGGFGGGGGVKSIVASTRVRGAQSGENTRRLGQPAGDKWELEHNQRINRVCTRKPKSLENASATKASGEAELQRGTSGAVQFARHKRCVGVTVHQK